MEFEIGQNVKVINPRLKAYKELGIITDYSEDGYYEVRFNSGFCSFINGESLEIVNKE